MPSWRNRHMASITCGFVLKAARSCFQGWNMKQSNMGNILEFVGRHINKIKAGFSLKWIQNVVRLPWWSEGAWASLGSSHYFTKILASPATLNINTLKEREFLVGICLFLPFILHSCSSANDNSTWSWVNYSSGGGGLNWGGSALFSILGGSQ